MANIQLWLEAFHAMYSKVQHSFGPYMEVYTVLAGCIGTLFWVRGKVGPLFEKIRCFFVKRIYFFAADCEQYHRVFFTWSNRFQEISGGLAWKIEGGHAVYDKENRVPYLFLKNTGTDAVRDFRIDYVAIQGNIQTREQVIQFKAAMHVGEIKRIKLNFIPNMFGAESFTVSTVWVERESGRTEFADRDITYHPIPRFFYWRRVGDRFVDIKPFLDVVDDVKMIIRYRAGPLRAGWRNTLASVFSHDVITYSVAWMLLLTKRRRIFFNPKL